MKVLEILLLVALLGLGLGLRLLNLTNPPLDFQPTRQLRAEIIARGMYYQANTKADPQLREAAIGIWSTMERYEPPILERLVALTYQVTGGERPWIGRIYSSLFWVIGGIALYALARRAVSAGGAMFALGFYLILPWGVIASRSFQPDPWMVMWILLAAYALYRWVEGSLSSWRWTALAGVFSGVAILIKANAFYPVAGMAACLLLSMIFAEGGLFKNLKRVLFNPRVWVYAVLSGIPPAVYYLGIEHGSGGFVSFWIFSFTGMLLDHKFYIRWLGLIRGMMDVMVLFAALLGVFLFRRAGRALVIGLWLGYLLIGATFPFQIYTHDYYSIVLVPIVALSLAPVAEAVLARVKVQPLLVKSGFAVALLAVSGYYAYVARSQVYAQNYRDEPIPWQIMGEKLPKDGRMIGLTHDYGDRLKYYGWRSVMMIWPSEGDLQLGEAGGKDQPAVSTNAGDFAGYFQDRVKGMDYFLVTLFGDLDKQPNLKAMLYDHYPIAQQGDGYVLFDLRHPK